MKRPRRPATRPWRPCTCEHCLAADPSRLEVKRRDRAEVRAALRVADELGYINRPNGGDRRP